MKTNYYQKHKNKAPKRSTRKILKSFLKRKRKKKKIA